MSILLQISRLIDAFTSLIGKLAMWLILATTLISAGNAVVRYALDWGDDTPPLELGFPATVAEGQTPSVIVTLPS